MVRRARLVFLLLFLTGLFGAPAEALLIIVEPDAFRPGTNLTNLFSGVTLNSYSLDRNSPDGIPVYGSVYATNVLGRWSGAAPTGTQMFAHDQQQIAGTENTATQWLNGPEARSCWVAGGVCSPSVRNDGGFRAMIIRFESPTNFFDIQTVWLSDPANIFAFDALNNQVGSCTGFDLSCNGIGSRSSFTYSSTNFTTLQMGSMDGDRLIQTIIIGGVSGTVGLDAMRYASVPEPSSILLLGAGLMMFFILSRKRVTGLH
ncbi:exported protein of unknown function [Candidatus Nitrospira inopinata]|jgi:hypothetical protein|uniref:Ice-binding protein C-terminal domain-containing protein n=2 Tax=Candidatus Nitrospira inopinata TaxID=1715989 RepID=A0A0S4KXF8_9BACT|nr:exported protein of unknown function [Candidatus Nitrospira inopinata]